MPMPKSSEAIQQFVSASVARVRLRSRIERGCLGLFAGASFALLYLVIVWAMGVGRGPITFLAASIPVLGALLAIALPTSHPLTDYEVAKTADDRMNLNDQLAGAYDFIRRQRDDALAGLTIQQTAQRLAAPGLVIRAVPFECPSSFWAFLVFGLLSYTTHQTLFPPPVKEQLSDATRRELEEGKQSLEGLLAMEAQITDEDQKKEFERIHKLIEELKMMSENATKDEILARLSREIADMDADAGKDDAMSKALDELKKYRERVAMGDLMDQVQQELDKGAEELAIVNAEGQKVQAEAIQTLALVDKQAMAEQRAKQDALAGDLKDIAKKQREKAEAAETKSELEKKLEKATEGSKKELKQGQLSYDALSAAVEDRDIRSMILTAAADKSRSSEDYREVYRNYQRILESVLFQQRVPSGQQLYVERYFKVIKPKEGNP